MITNVRNIKLICHLPFSTKTKIPPLSIPNRNKEYYNGLLTNSQRVKRKIAFDPTCFAYVGMKENWSHVLRWCVQAAAVCSDIIPQWSDIIPQDLKIFVWSMDDNSWFINNLKNDKICNNGLPWIIYFGTAY